MGAWLTQTRAGLVALLILALFFFGGFGYETVHSDEP